MSSLTKPRIIGLISWWDESPTWLAATVASLGRFCDDVVALDGRYATYPGSRVQSGRAEFDAIVDTARSCGMGVTIMSRPSTYTDEMHKRSTLFNLAAPLARPGIDWYFIIDGDESVIESPSKDEMSERLRVASELDQWVITASLFEKDDPHRDALRTDISRKVAIEYATECATPRFWRVGLNMRVAGYHFNYLGEHPETGETIEYWGMDGVVKNRPAWGSLNRRVVLENRNQLRAKVRDGDRMAYYKDRDESGLEKVVPLSELETIKLAEVAS